MGMIKYVDRRNSFIEFFDPATGQYMRTGVIVDGKDTNEDPFMRDYPGLIDVGVMGHCEHGARGLCKQAGVQCYQKGFTKQQPHMTVEDFISICEQSEGRVFQLALGGRGDCNKHPQFAELLVNARQRGIVPNYTTSGLNLTDEEVRLTKDHCGAVAVSWYRAPYTIDAIQKFQRAGVKTNIHYVVSKSTIDEAIWQLKHAGGFMPGSQGYYPFPSLPWVNAVIFLLHKPVGQGTDDNCLDPSDPKVQEFYELACDSALPFKVGFDSCGVCGVINHCDNVDEASLDYCEGARYSMYITPDMKALPCSFDQDERWAVTLKGNTIAQAWESPAFEAFRTFFRISCPDCPSKVNCGGGCPIIPKVSLCDRKEKVQAW